MSDQNPTPEFHVAHRSARCAIIAPGPAPKELRDWERRERIENLTLGELRKELRELLDPMVNPNSKFPSLEGVTACYEWTAVKGFRGPVLTDSTKLADISYRWIAVFAVTGGNEGHYVHVDLIVNWRERKEQINATEVRVPLFLGKTFGGQDEAIALAGELSRLLGV